MLYGRIAYFCATRLSYCYEGKLPILAQLELDYTTVIFSRGTAFSVLLGYPIATKRAAYFCVVRLSYHYEKELPILAQLDYMYYRYIQ